MDTPEWMDLALFSAPSGEPLDGTLSELLISAGNLINKHALVGAMMFLVDAEGKTARAGLILHPLAHDIMARRLRAAADELDRTTAAAIAPATNRSVRVN